MKQENDCKMRSKIICKRCGWEADEFAIAQIRRGELIFCPHCCWSRENELSDKDKKRKIMMFLKEHQLAVIATHNKKENTPESALIAFVEDEKFCLYFQTGNYTRKAKNLGNSSYVSLVIGLTLYDMATIQYEGRAELIQKPHLIAACKKRFLEKRSPTTAEHFERPEAIFYKVMPTWIRFSEDTKGHHSSVIVLIGDAGTKENSNDSSAVYKLWNKSYTAWAL